MKLKALAGVLAVAGLAMPGLASATNGYFSHGYGIKAKGMGGVGIALPQDSLAAATNPAGMVMVGDRLDLGVDWFRPVRGSEVVGNGAGLNGTNNGNDTQDFFIPEFGYNMMLGEKMSVGVSVYGNGGMNTDYKNNPLASFGGTGSAGVNLEQLFIAPTFAMKLNKDHAVGVSLNLAYQRFSAKGIPALFGGFSSSPNDMTDKGTDTSTGWGVRLGWTGQLTPDLTVGATYQSKTRMSNLDKYKGLFAEQGGFDIPENYGLGIAFKATPKLTVAADVVQINYSDVKAIANPLANLFVPNQFGSSNGPGFGWKDMTVYKLGASYDVSKDLVVRAGYNHGKQPIPSSETFLNFLAPGVVEDHITLGATWTLANKSEVSVSYMHALKKTVNGSGSIPGGFGGGESNLNMYQDSLGIAYGWKM